MIDVARQSLYYTLYKRNSDFILLKDNQDNICTKVEVLKTFEFSSERKLMSMIVNMDGKQYAFVKGADTSMEPICTHLDDLDKNTLDDLDYFAE